MLRWIWSCLLVGVLCGTVSAYSGGTGEPNDPYQIATAEDLIDLGNHTHDYDMCFVMTADIDLSGYLFDQAVIAPDGKGSSKGFQGSPFTGSLNGGGYIIYGLVIDSNSDYAGLFGLVEETGELLNIQLEDGSVRGDFEYQGGSRCGTGALAGESRGLIQNCHTNLEIRGEDYVGGLVGENGGVILGSSSSSHVEGDAYIGGLVGLNCGTIISSNSHSTTNGNQRVGGVVGLNEDTILLSSNTGTVSGNRSVGGVVGYSEDLIQLCSNSGTVSGKNYVGGIVGETESSTLLSYNHGSVSGDEYVGGLIGLASKSILYCYSSGSVIGNRYVGGLSGSWFEGGTITSSFWDIQTSGLSSNLGGTGLTTAQMQDPNTFLNAGWDLLGESIHGTSDLWIVPEGNYPTLAVFLDHLPTEPNGSGTPDDPYLLVDANDLGKVWLRPSACYRLDADIDLTGIVWKLAVIPWFNGQFNGNGHLIRNLQIEGRGVLIPEREIEGHGPLGLFGYSQKPATISNLGLKSVNINGKGSFVGGVVGYNNGIITTSYCHGTINGFNFVGGLVGYNSREILSCYSHGTVNGYSRVGGLTGSNRIINSSYSTVKVSGEDHLGGLTGYDNRGSSGLIFSSFWDTETSGLSTSRGGTGLTTTEMQDINTFLNAGWDFAEETTNGTDDTWWMPVSDYPRLWWELVE